MHKFFQKLIIINDQSFDWKSIKQWIQNVRKKIFFNLFWKCDPIESMIRTAKCIDYHCLCDFLKSFCLKKVENAAVFFLKKKAARFACNFASYVLLQRWFFLTSKSTIFNLIFQFHHRNLVQLVILLLFPYYLRSKWIFFFVLFSWINICYALFIVRINNFHIDVRQSSPPFDRHNVLFLYTLIKCLCMCVFFLNSICNL